MVMSGPASFIVQGSRLYLSANDVTLILEGREKLVEEQPLTISILSTGGFPIPDSPNAARDSAQTTVVRDAAQLNTLWSDAIAQGNNLGVPPDIEFEQSLVMYLRLGAGFRLHATTGQGGGDRSSNVVVQRTIGNGWRNIGHTTSAIDRKALMLNVLTPIGATWHKGTRTNQRLILATKEPS